MPLSVRFNPSDKITHIVMNGLVTRQDYRKVMPHLEALVDDTGPLNILLVLNNFEGWAPGNLQGVALSSLGDMNQVGRIAICANDDWRGIMMDVTARSCQAVAESFDEMEVSTAKAWLSGSATLGLSGDQDSLLAG